MKLRTHTIPKVHTTSTALLLILLLATGCQKDDNPVDPDNNETDVIMPFAVGNQWSFIDSIFNATSGAFVRTDSSRLGITGATTIQYQGASVEVFYWNWTNLQSGITDDWKWLTRNEPDGRYLYGGQSSQGTNVLGKYLAEKFPVTAGETWQNIRVIYRPSGSTFVLGDTVQMHCSAIDAPFVTLAGTLNCVVYSYQQVTTTSSGVFLRETSLYYAPNIGYVGLVGRTNGVVDYKKTLSSYTLN